MAQSYTFRPDRDDYIPGDDRAYEVFSRRVYIGHIEPDWLVGPIEGEPVKGWIFRHVDGRWAEGRSRPKAVEAALAQPKPTS
jgi:hypothetical protein